MRKLQLLFAFLFLYASGLTAQSTWLTPEAGYQVRDLGTKSFIAHDISGNNLFVLDKEGVYHYELSSMSLKKDFGKPTDGYSAEWPAWITADPDNKKIWVGYTVTGNTDDRIYSVDIKTGTWTKIATFPCNFDMEIANGNYYVSGLNDPSWSEPNSIYLLDITGGGDHKKLIEIGGNSTGLAVDNKGNVYNAKYDPGKTTYMCKWEASRIADVINGASPFLTKNEATILTSIPPNGPYDCDIDDAGNLVFNSNSSSGNNFVAIWNGTAGEDENYTKIATGSDWLTMIKTTGDVTTGTGKICMMAFNKPIVEIKINTTDQAPTLANPIADITVTEDASIATVDLNNVFDDADNDNSLITKEIKKNSNEGLLTASITGNDLQIKLKPDQNGEAEIIVLATSNAKTIVDTFTVTVTPVDDAPTLANPIADISLSKNAEDSVILLSATFTDIDNEDADITKILKENTNSGLVTATISKDSLRLSFTPDLEGTAEITVEATSNGKTVSDTFLISIENIDYTQGTFIVNEDWFGHDQGSVNFVNNDGKIVYRAYRRENPGMKLGVTTQFATIYGDKMYFVSKQAPRLVIADAQTLKKIKSIDEFIPNEPGNKSDGRSFIGVNDTLGYIATSKGIYTFSIKNLKVGEKIAQTDGETGNMLQANGHIFAIQKNKILILKEDSVISTIEGGNYAGLTRTVDGNVWVGGGDKLIKINPYTLQKEEVNLPAEAHIPASWYAWNANSFTASPYENAIYWGKKSGWSPSSEIYKYVIGNESSLTSPFISLSGDWGLYGAGLRIDPISKQVCAMVVEKGWGSHSSINEIQMFDAETGNLNKTIPLQDYYWFPAIPVFTDFYAPEVSLSETMTVDLNAPDTTISLHDFITDKDNPDCSIVTNIGSVSNGDLISASIVNDTLTIKFTENKYGSSDIALQINSNGKIILHTMHVTVINTADQAPTVANPIADITVAEGENISVIDLSNVFDDEDNDNSLITKEIQSNSNENLLSATITGNELQIDLTPNQNGEAEIVVLATSYGKTVADTFTVTVTPVDKAPTVANPIADITVAEGENISVIDLSNVFDDEDNDNSLITKEIQSNSNKNLLSAAITGNELQIELTPNQNGEAEIVVLATSNGKTVTDTFTVTVSPATGIKAPTSKNCTLYPNPSNGIFRIQLEQPGEFAVRIFDQQGKLIYSETNCNGNIDIHNQSAGTYIVQIIQGKSIITKKINIL